MNYINQDNKIKVALIANTGIGNEVFKALFKSSFVIIDSVLTRKLDGEFPYFKTDELNQLVNRNGIKCFHNIDANIEYFDYLKMQNIDLIIVATFNQILKKHLIDLPKLGIINYHPSLLPKYKGPSPISWVLLKDELKTGITIHKLSIKVDAGDILLQDSVEIENNEYLGSLFQKLSLLAGQMTPLLIDRLLNKLIIPKEQIEVESSYFSKPINENFIDETMDFNSIYRIVKAFHPFPKAIFKKDETFYRVNNYSFELKDIKMINPSKEEILIINNKTPLYLHLIKEK